MDRESHYVWGKRLLLKVAEVGAAPEVRVQHATLVLRVRPGADVATREAVLAAWYRQQIKNEVAPIVMAWERRLSVSVDGIFVQQMKTKWASCNPRARTIRLNTELAKKPKECLEYIVVHEMAHLLDPTHGPRFLATMDRVLPSWRDTRDLLNRLPASHQRWAYGGVHAGSGKDSGPSFMGWQAVGPETDSCFAKCESIIGAWFYDLKTWWWR